jgi:hypothetical protein
MEVRKIKTRRISRKGGSSTNSGDGIVAIYAVAKGDISRYDEVTGYGLHKCLTYLTFEKQKTEIEQREIQRINKQR